MKTNKLIKLLQSIHACFEAIEWVRENNITTLAEAWAKCECGDWMLWFAGKRSGEPEGEGRKVLVLASCECARLALPYAKSPTVLACIETAEAWAHGKATLEQVREARDAAAYASASYAAYADASAAAYAASFAALHTAHGDGAAIAIVAAYAASAAYDKRTETLKQCADIVRKHYPKAPRASKAKEDAK